jgi:hypothetical protein
VVSGDTLWAISEHFCGDGSKYQVIAVGPERNWVTGRSPNV